MAYSIWFVCFNMYYYDIHNNSRELTPPFSTCLLADPEVSLPILRLFEHSGRNGTSLSQLVRVMSHKDVESLLSPPMPRKVTGEPDSQQGQLVAPKQRPGHSLAAFQVLRAAVAMQPFLLNNWWHAHDGEHRHWCPCFRLLFLSQKATSTSTL